MVSGREVMQHGADAPGDRRRRLDTLVTEVQHAIEHPLIGEAPQNRGIEPGLRRFEQNCVRPADVQLRQIGIAGRHDHPRVRFFELLWKTRVSPDLWVPGE